MEIEAETELIQSQSRYTALVQECNAEESNLDAINTQREHLYQMNKAEAYEALAQGQTSIVMGGTSGENLINKIFSLE
jgi:hypothetical protein